MAWHQVGARPSATAMFIQLWLVSIRLYIVYYSYHINEDDSDNGHCG